MAKPGNTASHHTKLPVTPVALESSLPHDACPSGPSPRYDSVASAMIAAATANDASTSTGVTPFGSMWRNSTLRSGSPAACAPCTKSCRRSLRNSARVKRAAPVHDTQPMIAIIT